jgi:uncharacterized protein YqeY
MTLKEKIQADFILAMKTENEIAKMTLNSLKAQIKVAEKANKNIPLTDEQTLKVLTSAVKQRKQFIEAFQLSNRLDLVQKEQAELSVFEAYLPKQMTDVEIQIIIKDFLFDICEPSSSLQKTAIVGKAMGAFNKQFPGQAEPQKVKQIIKSLL